MSPETTQPHRILVVDDEPDITALVAYHLAKEGYRVTTAGTGADALRSALEERPDMVVLDLMLPGHSGYEVLAELRRRDETRDDACDEPRENVVGHDADARGFQILHAVDGAGLFDVE